MCDTGKSQSPIDIRSMDGVQNDFELTFDYHDADGVPFFNTGHTVQVGLDTLVELDTLEVRITDYVIPDATLQQFHFHTPSENTLNGEHFDMEVHFLHSYSVDNFVVVGVWIESGDDECDFLKQLQDAGIPQKKDDLEIIDLSSYIDFGDQFYSFAGSLTIPPCTENVDWYVKVHPVICTASQIEAFSSVIGVTNRPVQPLNSRIVTQNFDGNSGISVWAWILIVLAVITLIIIVCAVFAVFVWKYYSHKQNDYSNI